ncbi:PKD domain-containing protein [Candidatus Woesearchaeota archaeon]|nr:PKD domain-containing protein [Candidatus Woesearchaeota archaeon]
MFSSRVFVVFVLVVLSLSFVVFADSHSSEVVVEQPFPEESTSETVPESPEPLAVTITATPLTGVAPLPVQFLSAVVGKQPLVYSWDFNGDGLADSSLQNPMFTFENSGSYIVSLSVNDAEGRNGTQTVLISVSTYDSGLNISSYFPSSVAKGQNQITFLVINNGKVSLRDVSAKIVADGIQQTGTTSISLLRPGDQDSITVTALFHKTGEIKGILKFEDKKIPLTFSVKEPVSYNVSALQDSFQDVKKALMAQESLYTAKKAEGFLVVEIYDAIKTAQKQVQDAQQQLLTQNYHDAKLAIDLANTTITDVTASLQNARKQKQSPLIWLKDNAVAITAIVAASGTISGLLIKVKNKASKIGENVKMKIVPTARKREEEIVDIESEKEELEKGSELQSKK